jgi:hypothetical protein
MKEGTMLVLLTPPAFSAMTTHYLLGIALPFLAVSYLGGSRSGGGKTPESV